MGTDRKGSWIEGWAGRRLWPLDIRPEDVDACEAAHVLAKLPRYAGHGGDIFRHYSVAEHCCLLADYAEAEGSEELARYLLIHDVPEAMGLMDLPRPLKRSVPELIERENKALEAVCARLGLAWPMPDKVHELDARIILDEREVLFPYRTMAPWDMEELGRLGVSLEMLQPPFAKMRWLQRFEHLFGYPADTVVAWNRMEACRQDP